jgi:polar amino acid transport system substrate-binding protein
MGISTGLGYTGPPRRCSRSCPVGRRAAKEQTKRSATKQTHGVPYDLGAEFARRPVEYVTFQRVADVVSAIKNGEVDFTVTNATPARANDVSFSPPIISVELGYLVSANSPISRADDLDRPGVRIGVTKGSTSERSLPARFRNAKIVPADQAGGRDARPRRTRHLCNQQAHAVRNVGFHAGARVLDGNWGLEHMAIAVPKGREQGLAFVAAFVKEVQSNGLLERIQQQAGLRGAVKAEPK